MNVCDSMWIKFALTTRGWEESSEREADIILINTCSVRKKPEHKVFSELGRIKSLWLKKPSLIVGVGGCVAQQLGERIWNSFPFVRLIFGTDGVPSVPDALVKLISNPQLRISLLDFYDYYPEREKVWYKVDPPPSCYVNIMQGCNNFCSYCIVPFTRGPQKSRKSIDIIEECKELVERGVQEITLLGQNVNSYGKDKYGDGVSFVELLKEINKLEGLKRIRFTTSHPKDLGEDLILAFGDLEKLCPALHLPVQSGSNSILKKMNRKYTREEYLKKVEMLRKIRPDIVITTDIIVGFPQESEKDFEETLKLVKEVEFDSSFSFKYSDRPGTKAASMEGKIDEKVKAERLLRLQELQDKLTYKSLERLKGEVVEVLVEGYSKKGEKQWQGREPGGRIVNFYSQRNDLRGRIVKVKITKVKKHSLYGEVI